MLTPSLPCSIERVSVAISCYDPSEALVLGEVYGYRASPQHLIPYPTGGSGVLLSRPMVTILV